MNILFFNYEFPPLGGGAATANYFLFKEFSRNKSLRINLITSSSHHESVINFSRNIEIVRLNIGKRGKSQLFQKFTSIILYFVKSTAYAMRLARKKRFDVSVVFFAFPSGITALLMKILFRIPYIISLRGSDVPGFNERFTYLYPILRPIFRLIIQNSVRVVANSDDLKALAMESGIKKKVEVIPNGVDVDFFKPAKTKKNKDAVVFLTVARLIKRKALDVLIRSASKIKSDIPFEVQIVGDGDERKNLKNIAKETHIANRIKFLGEVGREKINKVYQGADVFVLSSKNEGMSNALLEAMASGLPIISTMTGGVSSNLKNNFLLVKVNDEKGLTDKMEELLENGPLRSKMAEKSRALAETLRWQVIADRYLQLINSSLNNG